MSRQLELRTRIQLYPRKRICARVKKEAISWRAVVCEASSTSISFCALTQLHTLVERITEEIHLVYDKLGREQILS